MLFLTVFGVTFLAELPDKTFFAALLLGAKRSHVAVFCGVALAFLVQTFIAVAFGRVLGLLPPKVIHAGVGLMFLGMAGWMYAREDEEEEVAEGGPRGSGFWADFRAAFVVIFIAEWGDLTQLSTAAFEAHYHRPLLILGAATLALWAVTAVAVGLGRQLGQRLKPRTLSRVAAIAFAVVGLVFLAGTASAAETGVPETPIASSTPTPSYDVHYQATTIEQGHSRIHAPYMGPHSFQADPERDVSVTATLFFGWRPFKNTQLYLDPELSGGQGMSGAEGIAGFPNGETYRIGNPEPVVKTARLYVQQAIALGDETERVDEDLNQIAGYAPRRRLTLVAGKFGMMDWFDNNAYSHDPRTQFMNWALANSAAWDYPADTFGYTWGFVAECHEPGWSLRAGAAAEPKVANQVDLDRRVLRAQGAAVEGERRLSWNGRPATLRLLLFSNQARMGNYDQAIGRAGGAAPDVTATRAYGRTKFGFTSSDDAALSDSLGAFTRLSWNDGRNETWAYDEVDGSLALGLDWLAGRWGRPQDHLAAAEVVNVLSGPHRRYLADGGLGFMLGDGALRSGPELDTELYYRIQVNPWLQVSPDAQLVVNPGYNRNRGPVPVWGVRVHAQL